ncbi:tetratricopeptide repeat protein [Thermospira aquatica]|uniref:Tetratricopeptide repeat protein n=1 Tax=Thermospira aquatica TaxID=2828656 RepID=A0AAX3BFE2_9SPIR|nr:tetratricopeptide repeat protein [Thermospira aquatica]URA10779.1 tetratricopeptide repeat protein [Thermospira aquatica]
MFWFTVAIVLAGLTAYFLYATMQEGKTKQAQRAVESGDLDTALSIFMESLRHDPNNVEALWHLGNINEEKGLIPEAIGYYVKLIEIGKESKLFTMFELYRRVGLLYRRLGRDNDALDYLLQAYQIIPSAKDVIREIADILFSQKSFFRALSFFEKGAVFLKDEAPFIKQYAFCLIMTDKVEMALPMLEALEKMFSHDIEFLFLLSFAYFKTAAYQRAREIMEIALNSNFSLPLSMMYFGVKLLFVCYLYAKNYEIAKQLWDQLKNLSLNYTDEGERQRELSMALIMLRTKQGYYENAMEELKANFQKEIASGETGGGSTLESKQSQSFLYKLLAILHRYKKEQEKEAYMGSSAKQTLDYARLENEAKDAMVKLDQVYQQWLSSFITKEELWANFRPKVSLTFDPIPILEKYLAPKEKLKKSSGKPEHLSRNEKQGKYETLGLNPNNPCESLLSVDFPSFTIIVRELASDMGYRVLSQVVKVDPHAYGEAKGFDLLCEEKADNRSRVLFCVRRWTEPIGSIYLTNLLSAAKEFDVERIVMVATSSLSQEAERWLETNKKLQYLNCEDIISFLLN